MENKSFTMFLKKYWFVLLCIIVLCWAIYYSNTHESTQTLADEIDITQTKFEVIDSVLLKEYSHNEAEARTRITISQMTMNSFLESDSPFVKYFSPGMSLDA